VDEGFSLRIGDRRLQLNCCSNFWIIHKFQPRSGGISVATGFSRWKRE
jgi:hypothetical protein